MKKNEIDLIAKLVVLILMTLYLGYIIVFSLYKESGVPDLPDYIVSIFTIVFLYFFRRSPKPDNKGE